MTKSTPLVQVRRLSKVYQGEHRDTVALDRVSFSIHRGELVALMGPYGSGKSTLMSLLGLLDQPTSGDYWFDGTDMSALSHMQRAQLRGGTIGVYFPHGALLSRLSLLENVALPLQYSRLSRQERQAHARQALAAVGLTAHEAARPAQLTAFEQQLALLARTLVTRPGLLLVDELLSTADPDTYTGIISTLRRLNHQQGLTVVIVTHDPEIACHTDRVIGLRDGKLCSDILDACYDISLTPRLSLPADKLQAWSN